MTLLRLFLNNMAHELRHLPGRSWAWIAFACGVPLLALLLRGRPQTFAAFGLLWLAVCIPVFLLTPISGLDTSGRVVMVGITIIAVGIGRIISTGDSAAN